MPKYLAIALHEHDYGETMYYALTGKDNLVDLPELNPESVQRLFGAIFDPFEGIDPEIFETFEWVEVVELASLHTV
jgi:hypothetical protein